jgi:putative Mn2+ efflux pump MntP
MPTLGYITTSLFKNISFTYDYIISFILLLYMGIKMIYDTLKNKNTINNSLSFTEMFMFSIATSIDAFSAGISLSLYGNRILKPTLLIFIITFINSLFGFKLGGKLKNLDSKYLEIFAGLILIFLGIKAFF